MTQSPKSRPLRLGEPLALLVDEHPLDTYLAAAATRPPRVILVHSPERAAAARALVEIIERRLVVPGTTLELGDPTSSVAARRAHAELPGDCHLHHTGGDGSMAANLRAAHHAAARPLASASCLDEERRILRLDDGVDLPLLDLVDPSAVSIAALAELGGFRVLDDPDRERLEVAGRAVLNAAWPLPWEQAARLMGHGRTAIDFLREHLDRHRPDDGVLAHDGRWTLFRSGIFLELLVERFLREAAPWHETRSGVRLERDDGMRVELDVLSVGRYRPYVYSCSTTDTLETAKRKAFELLVRARQVGGLTARPILVTALVDEVAAQVSEIATVDSDSPVGGVRVLGIRDLVGLGMEPDAGQRQALLGLEGPFGAGRG